MSTATTLRVMRPTMKNTVYAIARTDPIDHAETFALRLAEHFAGKPAVSVRISVAEQPWSHLATGGPPHPHAFVQAGGEHWTTVVTRDRDAVRIVSGLAHLVVLKTADSAFSGFPRDEFTTLPETDDRIWRPRSPGRGPIARARPGSRRAAASRALLDTFAAHRSRSVQHTLYAMGEGGAGGVARRHRDHADAAEPASPARRPDAVRAQTRTRSSWRPTSRTASSRRRSGDKAPRDGRTPSRYSRSRRAKA